MATVNNGATHRITVSKGFFDKASEGQVTVTSGSTSDVEVSDYFDFVEVDDESGEPTGRRLRAEVLEVLGEEDYAIRSGCHVARFKVVHEEPQRGSAATECGPLAWEKFIYSSGNYSTARLPVIGGWVVMHTEFDCNAFAVTSVFVPDPHHTWRL